MIEFLCTVLTAEIDEKENDSFWRKVQKSIFSTNIVMKFNVDGGHVVDPRCNYFYFEKIEEMLDYKQNTIDPFLPARRHQDLVFLVIPIFFLIHQEEQTKNLE